MHLREMVRIWIALLHQEKPVHNVYWFFFFGAEEDLNSNDDDRSQRLKQGGELLGPRSDFSKPRQGAAEKSANATRKALTARFRRGSQPVEMSIGRPAAKIENPNLFSIGEGFGFFVFFGKLNECSKGYPMVTCTSTTAPSGASGSRLPSMGLPSTATLFTPYWTAAVLSTAM